MKLFGRHDDSRQDPVLEGLTEKVSQAQTPTHVKEVISRELELLGRIGPSTTEYTIGLTYIEYLLSLPWNIRTEDIHEKGSLPLYSKALQS